ncbi:MAG: DNA polymerase III subunit delta [Oscillospiraceae bacterium]|nr:DNA polymerase III subunit delta [Oscillospiraceae bacterium]
MVSKLSDTTLRNDLKKGLKQFYFIAGNDSFLIDNCLRLISEAVDGEGERMDFSETDTETAEGQLTTYSFSNKLLIIDNFKASEFTGEKKSMYAELLADLPATLTVATVLYSDDPRFRIPKSAENMAEMAQESAVVSCLKKEREQLYPYIRRMAELAGAEISGEAASVLTDLCGDDLQLLSSQIEKLAAASGYGEIKEDTVRRMCPRTTEENVFSFIRAVERGQNREAVTLLNEMLETETEPVRVLAAISGSFVNIARVKAAEAAGVSRDRLEEEMGYRKGDRALGVAYSNARRYSQEKIDNVIYLLNETDRKLKSGAADKRIILEQAMVRLALIVSGRS